MRVGPGYLRRRRALAVVRRNEATDTRTIAGPGAPQLDSVKMMRRKTTKGQGACSSHEQPSDSPGVLLDLDPYLSLRTLGTYSGLSVRTLRKALVDAARPLPHYRVGGKILVRRSEFDRWIAQFRQEGAALDRLVAEILGG